ncbi:hypothetical protein GEMRC1_002869 [Eukaryota sp. GEM-RC1]
MCKVFPLVLRCTLLSDVASPHINSLLDKFLSKLLQEARSHSPYAIKFLLAIKFDGRVSSFLRQKVLDSFNDDHFFFKNFSCLSDWLLMINHTVSEPFSNISGDTAVSQFVAALNTIFPPKMMYLSNNSECKNRVGFLYRLAFIILAAEYNAFSSKVGVLLERIMELLNKHGKTSVSITTAGLLALRCLICRVSHQHLRSHWGTIIPELIRILSQNEVPPTLLLSVCKLLDILLVVSPEDLHFSHWIFFKDLLLEKIQYCTEMHIPFVSQIATKFSTTDVFHLEPAVLPMRAPLISSPVLSDEGDAAAALASIVPALTRHASLECSVERRPDYRAIDKSILLDFVQGDNLYGANIGSNEFHCFLAELYCVQ